MVFTQNIPTNIKFYLDKNSIIRKTLNKGLCHFYTGCRAGFPKLIYKIAPFSEI